MQTIDEYVNFLDRTIHAFIPDEKDAELYNFVKTYQVHRHSKSCKKYVNKPCRYHFGRFFSSKTIIAKPLPKGMSSEEKQTLIDQRNAILSKVKLYIDEFLDPSKSKYIEHKSIKEILDELHINENEYYKSLSISTSVDFEVHLYRPPNSCFINNYNPVMLRAWKANMDLQPVFNYYKAVSYMAAYFSKSESESSIATSFKRN